MSVCSHFPGQAWEVDALDIMSDRLVQLHHSSKVAGPSPIPAYYLPDVELSPRRDTVTKASSGQNLEVRGWTLLDESSGWKPCPIGVYNRTSL